MAIFDVRKDVVEHTTRIVFAEPTSERTFVAHFIVPFNRRDHAISIGDGTGEKVVISSKQHALDLIKALEKSIAVGWLK
ncbi:hypothetical protein vBPFY1MI_139 [Pseudomonas phage vB_PF_Y1-MI]|nr:hypothetical protein vBPFY1MI_139 [Pseudomonas phage vB_PF_Y1-MI]